MCIIFVFCYLDGGKGDRRSTQEYWSSFKRVSWVSDTVGKEVDGSREGKTGTSGWQEKSHRKYGTTGNLVN